MGIPILAPPRRWQNLVIRATSARAKAQSWNADPWHHLPRRDGLLPALCLPQLVTTKNDLDAIGDDLVCLSLVTDPFGEHDTDYLRQCFPDVVVPFKEHAVVDLSQSPIYGEETVLFAAPKTV